MNNRIRAFDLRAQKPIDLEITAEVETHTVRLRVIHSDNHITDFHLTPEQAQDVAQQTSEIIRQCRFRNN